MITQDELDLAAESFYFQSLHDRGSRIAKYMAELILTQPAVVAMAEEAYKAGFRDAVGFCNKKNEPQGQITG